MQTIFLRLLLTILCAPSLCFAIDINLNYQVSQSQAPSFDPDGSRLQALVSAAAEIYEDIIEDDAVLDLTFTWGDLGDTGTLGVATTTQVDGTRPTVSRMRFNTNDAVNWFLDATPSDNSEFDLIQTTYSGLDAATQDASFTGSPPANLEVGFAGVRRDFQRTTDLFSVIIHEFGHALGLIPASIGASANDGDFDVAVEFGGTDFGITVSSEDDIAHLAAPRTALFPVIPGDVRRLPSATDIFAIASAAGWQEIDLPRKEFLGSTAIWDLGSNWIGGRVPDAEDQVTVRDVEQVTITSQAVADSLRIDDDVQLALSGGIAANQLSVGNTQLTIGNQFAGINITDELVVNGAVLDVAVTRPIEAGEQIVLLTADSLQGEFDQISAERPSFSVGLVVDQLPNSVVATAAIVGDVDINGVVDFGDFLALSGNFGLQGEWRDGDLSGNGVVDFADFLDLSLNFGSQVSRAAVVPEPGFFSIWIVATLLFLRNAGLSKRKSR